MVQRIGLETFAAEMRQIGLIIRVTERLRRRFGCEAVPRPGRPTELKFKADARIVIKLQNYICIELRSRG